MALVCESKFSLKSNSFIIATPDGNLKIYNTNSGSLEQQFTPSSHLSASCTCLSCCSLPSSVEKSKKRKKKKLDDIAHQDYYHLVAIGTLSGSIILYNVTKGEIETQFSNGHTAKINDVCWNEEAGDLFSCSDDGYIVHWNVEMGGVKSNLKSEEGLPVFSIAYINKDNLLSASRSILWWNLSTKSVIKKFTGHATEINRLIPITFSAEDSVEESYFLSSAVNDRMVNAWKMKCDENRIAIGVFSVNEDVTKLDVSKFETKSEPTYVFAITKSGSLKIFKHQLNGVCKKPIKFKISVQIASEEENGLVSVPVPILDAKIINSEEFLMVYGSYVNPIFERMQFNKCTRSTCLVRKHPASSITSLSASNTKIKTPEVKSNSKVLLPGHSYPSLPQEESEKKLSKRKKVDTPSLTEMTIEDRLNCLKVRRASCVDSIPQADNKIHLLTQGLQSGDVKMLNSVLQSSVENEIHNTVRKLPMQCIIPLLKELTKRMHGKSQSNHPYVKWVTSILINHTSYFTMNADAISLLSPLHELLNSKISTFQRILRLSGRLNLILSQVASRENNQSDIPTEPVLLYQEDSPDEDEDDAAMRPIHSESDDDDWNELSDLESMNQPNDEDMDSSAEDDDSSDEIDMT